MSPLRRTGRIAAVVGVLAATYGAGVLTGAVGTQASAPPAESGVLDEAAARIMADAATPVSRDQLDRAAVEGMLKALGDRWSAYYRPSEFESFQAGLDGRYSGIGVWMRRADDGQVYVGSVQPGTPAEQSGLVAGDRLVSVGGDAVTDNLQAVAAALRGEAGTAVRLVVERDGLPQDLTVTRGELASDDVVVSQVQEIGRAHV